MAVEPNAKDTAPAKDNTAAGKDREPGAKGLAASAVRMVRAAVARGHTIHHRAPPPLGKDGRTALGDDGLPSKPGAVEVYGPGSVIDLPEAEAKHLMAHGFLSDPGAPLPALGQGPTYGQDGNMVQTVRPQGPAGEHGG